MQYVTLIVLIAGGNAHSLFVNSESLKTTIDDCRSAVTGVLGFVTVDSTGEIVHYDSTGNEKQRTATPLQLTS